MTEETAATRYFDLIIAIVNIGKASRVLEEGRKKGITGGTISIGHGTISSQLLRKLGLLEVRKEVLFMVSERSYTLPVIDHLAEVLHLHEPNKGIIFSTALSGVLGTQGECLDLDKTDTVQPTTHELFVSIVPAEMSDQIIEAVRLAGGAGGTILHGHSAFNETTQKVFGIEIDAEKEMILNLVEKNLSDHIEKTLVEQVQQHAEEKTLLFSMDAQHVRGIYQK